MKKTLIIEIGVFILMVFMCIYNYYFPYNLNNKNLIKIDGVLQDKPFYGATNDDGSNEYVTFRLLNDKRIFIIEHCGFQHLKYNQIMSLGYGDSIKLKIKKNKKTVISKNDFYTVVEFFEKKTGYLLELKDVNNCFLTYWKIFLKISILLFIIILAQILWPLIKFFN